MAKEHKPALSAIFVDKVRPEKNARKYSDGHGLHLLVTPKGGKLWRLAYRFERKQKLLSFGVYPAVSLADARLKRDQALDCLKNGRDPAEIRRTSGFTVPNSFEQVAREWHLRQAKGKWTPRNAKQILERLTANAFPFIGEISIANIGVKDILSIVHRIESRGCYELAHRVLQIIDQIFRYAILVGLTKENPCPPLRGALAPHRLKHHAAITEPERFGVLLRDIDDYPNFVTRCALQLTALVFVRQGELIAAEWTEVNFDAAEWHIPAVKMKMKQKHIVPLAKQTINLLLRLKEVTGSGKYLFPTSFSAARHISNNTLNFALRRMDYTKEDMTAHGFRSSASTLLNEMGIWSPDAIERQLAHCPQNKVRASYNYAQFLMERKVMMQVWADYLDGLKDGKIMTARELLKPEYLQILRENSILGLRIGG